MKCLDEAGLARAVSCLFIARSLALFRKEHIQSAVEAQRLERRQITVNAVDHVRCFVISP